MSGSEPTDLEVTEFSVSDTNPTAGSMLTLSATVRNIGDGAAAATTLRYYQSTDATITTADTVVGTASVAGLAAGGSSSESVDLTAPSTSGTYYYGACVDAVAEESDTTNNCSMSVQVEVSEPTDLEVTAFSVSDTNPTAGSMLTLSATIRNNSDSAIVDVLVRYAFDRAGYGTETPATTRIAVLAASESFDDSAMVRVPSPGTYEFWVYVVDHSQSTTDGNNFSERITVTVTEPPPDPGNPEPACCPDLVVNAFSVSDTNPIAGSMLTLSATVRNIGTGASGGATLEYSVAAGRGELAARTRLAGLAASESINDSVVVRVPSPGTYEYKACVRESTAPPSTDNCSRDIEVTVEQQTPDDPSIDPRFDDAFWQEFVFGQKDQPFTLDHQVIEVLNTTSPNVYIYTGVGHQVIPDEHRDLIREAIPPAAEQLTGQRYTGRIESGTEHLVERVGWITVRYFTDADGHNSCGFTRVGADPNTIFLNHDCMKRRGPDAIAYLKHVFVHEFGHAMGFKHVLAPNAVMGAGNSGTFTAREQFHAQLAYKVGRWARYCGWPFSAECEQVNAIAGPNANMGTRSHRERSERRAVQVPTAPPSSARGPRMASATTSW